MHYLKLVVVVAGARRGEGGLPKQLALTFEESNEQDRWSIR
jgi:hypothetical protein